MSSQKYDEQSTSSLYLDPGTTRRPGRSISGCKCILLTIGLLILSGIGLSFFFTFERFVGEITQPHHLMYEEEAPDNMKNPLAVVQPLISREDTFDIAATVWIRNTEKIGHGDVFALERNKAQWDPLVGGLEVGENVAPVVDLDNELETPIFSDIVFRGLRLTDKHVFSTVNFSLPTAVFRTANLSNLDLRGSFVLIPSSPSLLDHLTNYSSGFPDEIKPFPARSWPFPLNSEQAEKSLADKAIESLSVTIPLLSFQDVHTRCPDDSIDTTSLEEEDDEVVDQPPLDGVSDSLLLETTNGKPLLKSHPYVITRTQIHVIDQTNLFNRKAYIKAHKALKATACRQTGFGDRASRYLCEMDYRTNGHWMTQMQLGLKQTNGKVQTKWAYSPYMAATRASAGPKDLLMIPVNRENCRNTEASDVTSSSKIPPEQDIINVSWKLSYSGRSPAKHIFSSFAAIQMSHDLNQSDYDRTLRQDTSEITFGLSGHRFSQNSHPRRRAFLIAAGAILAILIVILDIRYWYTRGSTVGISILGTTVIAGAELFVQVASTIAKGRVNRLSVSGWIMIFLVTLVTSLILPLLMLKAIARIEFGWWNSAWIPVMQRARTTHKERASERLETKVTWFTRVGLLLSLVVLYSSISPHNYLIIPSILPAPAPGDFAPDRLADLSPYFIHPIYFFGKILQLTLNHYSKSFAGSYRLTAVLALALNLTTLVTFVPSLVGRFDARPGLSMHEVVDAIVLAVTAWQALTLPSVLQTDGDDHIE